VRTLTGHPERPHPFGEQLEVRPFAFAEPEKLRQGLEGARVLYNTYWIRFPRGEMTFARAVDHSRVLLEAARDAGVERVVHISITNPRLDSPLGYFSGKAQVEQAVRETCHSWAILRPTVLFSEEDVLLNNMTWLLRRFPLFPLPGRGDYRLQPVHVQDAAELAVQQGAAQDNVVLDAVGPEIWSFAELLRLLARAAGRRARLLPLPPALALAGASLVGRLVGDVLLTRDELAGLRDNLLVSADPPTCPTRLSEWLAAHGENLGREYHSELRRHY
jgi:NADH dehydrogenase